METRQSRHRSVTPAPRSGCKCCGPVPGWSAESWRLIAAPTKLCLHAPGDEALPIVFAAPGALGLLVAVWRLGLYLAPVVPPNQAAPIL